LERGILTPGWAADVLIFDPETVIDGPIMEREDLPGGATRLVSEPLGIEYVIVNGTVIREHGKDAVDPEGPLPGEILRRFAAHRPKKGPVPGHVFERVQELMDEMNQMRLERSGGNPPSLDPAQPGRPVWSRSFPPIAKSDRN
jgi:hypothetical protein